MSEQQLITMSPADLVIGANVRSAQVEIPKGLVASVRERGVLMPILAYRDAESGAVTVLAGQRRTLAAVEAGCAEVPVVVTDTMPEDADRLIDQWVENEQRAALTNRERVKAVADMLDLGVSVTAITRKTGAARAQVKAAAAAARSAAATEAADQLTLDEAAALADFDGDDAAIAKLLEAAKNRQFAHVHARLLRDRAEAEALASARADYEAAGVVLVDDDTTVTHAIGGDTPVWLTSLSDAASIPAGDYTRPEIDPDAHAAGCPGHAATLTMSWVEFWRDADGNALDDDAAQALIDAEMERRDVDADDYYGGSFAEAVGLSLAREQRPVLRPVCTTPERHHDRHARGSTQKRAADMTDEERAQATEARRTVVENNKAWRAAEDVRREWLAGTLAQRKTPPPGAEAYVARYIAANKAMRWNASIPGIDQNKLADELAEASAKRAVVIALVLTLVAWEADSGVHTWRNPTRWDRETLALLDAAGYRLSDIEQQTATAPADADEDQADDEADDDEADELASS